MKMASKVAIKANQPGAFFSRSQKNKGLALSTMIDKIGRQLHEN
jgi:hypothetical protein